MLTEDNHFALLRVALIERREQQLLEGRHCGGLRAGQTAALVVFHPFDGAILQFTLEAGRAGVAAWQQPLSLPELDAGRMGTYRPIERTVRCQRHGRQCRAEVEQTVGLVEHDIGRHRACSQPCHFTEQLQTEERVAASR